MTDSPLREALVRELTDLIVKREASLREENERLKIALHRYGDHRFHCAFVKNPSKNCDCGWGEFKVPASAAGREEKKESGNGCTCCELDHGKSYPQECPPTSHCPNCDHWNNHWEVVPIKQREAERAVLESAKRWRASFTASIPEHEKREGELADAVNRLDALTEGERT